MDKLLAIPVIRECPGDKAKTGIFLLEDDRTPDGYPKIVGFSVSVATYSLKGIILFTPER